MWLGLLGPMVVRQEDAELPVLPAKQRATLAALALGAGRVVSLDTLCQVVWDAGPPPHAAVTMRSYIKRLRQALGPVAGGRVITRAPGYLLDTGQADIDVLAFEALCRAGAQASRDGEWPRVMVLLGQALALWRGSPLADVPSELLHRERVPQLEQLRWQAVQRRMDAGLHLGLAGDLVPDLQALVAQHPMRETFHEQLMTALYQNGQRAEALAAFRQARSILVAELGIEPGDSLRHLHQLILGDDPSLLAHRSAAEIRGTPVNVSGSREATTPVPPNLALHQLPPVVPHFTGRDA